VARSAELADLVPRGGRYAFDLIAHVGVESYVHGRSLEDIGHDLAGRVPSIHISPSSLWDQQQKFLFYLGQMHQRASGSIRQYLSAQREVSWLLDGTLEPGTPVFLGIQEATSGLQLGGWKISSENADEIGCGLRDAADRYGAPARVWHDLSSAMKGACEQALPGIPHFVCHFHLARDIGEDLYDKPQNALCKRMRAIEVQVSLREQRKGQTDWFRKAIGPSAQLVLRELLAGRSVDVPFDQSLGREVVLAIHYWILDCRSDGRRRGFPFDPYLLYLHRRLVAAGQAVDRMLAHGDVARQAPQVLFNLQKQLARYRQDAQIVEAADHYERAWAMFGRLRDALRLSAEHIDHLHSELPVQE
jgi:hypothetical protein